VARSSLTDDGSQSAALAQATAYRAKSMLAGDIHSPLD
jgi:hypothetical protein